MAVTINNGLKRLLAEFEAVFVLWGRQRLLNFKELRSRFFLDSRNGYTLMRVLSCREARDIVDTVAGTVESTNNT
jgi:hypothetical protein